MDLKQMMSANTLNFRTTLGRIIEKYSKLQYQDGGIEVDLDNTNVEILGGYIEQSKKELDKLESKSLADLRDESLRAQDTTRVSQLDFTHQDSGPDESCASSVSSTKFSVDDGDLTRGDTTQLSASLLDESLRNDSVMDLQPEDQDEELEMSLRSHGSSLVELYPSMISRIERAWHQQHVSEAADSVLRRYRRWRKQPSRSHFKNTFIVAQRHGKPKETTRKRLIEEASDTVLGPTPTPWPPLQIATNEMDWKASQHSPAKARREPPRPVLVMDLSVSSDTSDSEQSVLNEAFSVSQLREQPSAYPSSPSRPLYSNAKSPFDLSLRSKRLSLAGRSPRTDGCSMYASQNTSGKQRPDIYGSPLRQSPLKVRMMMSGVSRSPHSFPRSPKLNSMESFSREPMRPRLASASLPSSPVKPPVQRRILYPQDFHHSSHHHSFQPAPSSPQPVSAAEGRHRFRRHHSFDSTLPSSCTSYSPKKLDEDFVKLYHKFFCQNKSSVFNGPPCRYCGKSSEANRGHSSSALAALALSPHRSLLRKRHRKFSWDNHPQSKRHRYEYLASSPGSKRHGNEMLRRRLSTYEYEPSQDGLCYSPSKRSAFPRFSAQQRSADAYQETWTRADRSMSAADFSGLGHHPHKSSYMF